MAILVNSGRAAMAGALMGQTFHLAVGSGDSAWDHTPISPDVATTTLLHEVGRHIGTTKSFCSASDIGEIEVPNGRFTYSADPTNHIHISVNFDFSDGIGNTWREIGLYAGGTTNPALPGGQLYFLPGDIVLPGILVLLEYIPAIIRSGSVRNTFEFVLTI